MTKEHNVKRRITLTVTKGGKTKGRKLQKVEKLNVDVTKGRKIKCRQLQKVEKLKVECYKR
jgi:hypothetical protein